MKKVKAADMSASVYEGQLEVFYVCVGPGKKCAYAQFHIEPPEQDDECVFVGQGQICRHGLAQKAALEVLLTKLNEEYQQQCVDVAGD